MLKLLEKINSTVQALDNRISHVENTQQQSSIPTNLPSTSTSHPPPTPHRPKHSTTPSSTPAKSKTKQSTIPETYAFACSGSMTPSHVDTGIPPVDHPLSSPSSEYIDSTSSWTTVGPKNKPIPTPQSQADDLSAAQSLTSLKSGFSWVKPSSSNSSSSSPIPGNTTPTVIFNYRVTKGGWVKANGDTKGKFNSPYVHELAGQLCAYTLSKYNREMNVIRVTPKPIQGNGDNMKFSGTIEVTPAVLTRLGTDGFQATRAHISKEISRSESLLQRAFTTKDFVFFDGMPYGAKAIQFDFPPVRAHDWYVCAIVVGAPPMLAPSTDSQANNHLADQLWDAALLRSEEGRTIHQQYETSFHRRKVMGVTVYNVTLGKTTHKLLGIAVPRSPEGNKIATAILRSSWDESNQAPAYLNIVGGMVVSLLPIPSDAKQRTAYFTQCVKEAQDTLKDTYTIRISSVSTEIFNPHVLESTCNKWDELIYLHCSAKYGNSNPGAVLVFTKTEDIVQSSPDEIAQQLYSKTKNLLKPPPKQAATTARYVSQAQANINSLRRNKPTVPRSADTSVSFAGPTKPEKSPTSVIDAFISKVERDRKSKSVFGFAKGKHSSLKPFCAVTNGPGGARSIGVFLWSDCEHRVKGCPFAVYQNFRTKEAAYAHLQATIPEANVHDDESARALWETVPLTATNLDNEFVYIAPNRRNASGGLMWIKDDDAALVYARQLHTVGHPNYKSDPEERAHALNELNGVSTPPATDEPPPAQANPTSSTSNPEDEDDSDDDMPQSQVDAYSPEDVTPIKRSRPNSQVAQPSTAFNPNTDTNIILFQVAAFTTSHEFQKLLLEYLVPDPALLGNVNLAKKKGEDDLYFVAAEFYDVSLGNNIITRLANQDFCHIPMNPKWATATTWAAFFTIYQKTSRHGNLDRLASSTLVHRCKNECPLSHHKQLDNLLCSTDNTFEILETYQSWFGPSTYSPFGNIEPSPF